MWSNHLSASVNPEAYEYTQSIHNSTGYPDAAGYILSIPIKQVKAKAYKGANHACNCVLWAQANGLAVSGYGAAINYPAVWTADPPQCGFAVTREGSIGHMVKYCRDGDWLVIDEANYVRCRVTYGRRLHIMSPLIKGYL